MNTPTRGTVLDGRFVVEAELGSGGMGVVVRARDQRLQRPVAIKFLSAEEAGNETFRRRFLREARAAARLSHPHIIQVHDVGETPEGDVFVVMELVAGRTLRALLESGAAPLHERVRHVVDVARALAVAHRAGLVHRDVKPDNLMVRDDGRVVVLDFGIARRTHGAEDGDAGVSGDGSLTQPGTLLGTPAYLAPEQVRSAAVDGRADQFALAITAWELLSGRIPWRARQPVALMSEILSRDAPRLSTALTDAPAGLDDVLARALARDPDARYPDLDAFAEALEPFAARPRASGESATPTTPRPPPPRTAAEEALAVTQADTSLTPPPPTGTPSQLPDPAIVPPSPRWLPVVAALVTVALVVAAFFALRGR